MYKSRAFQVRGKSYDSKRITCILQRKQKQQHFSLYTKFPQMVTHTKKLVTNEINLSNLLEKSAFYSTLLKIKNRH